VVERLIKAMRGYRPQTVRHFFALANQHMRWELNDYQVLTGLAGATIAAACAAPAQPLQSKSLRRIKRLNNVELGTLLNDD